MSKRTVSGIMLTLLFIGMLTLAFIIQPVKAEVIETGHIGTIHWGSGIVKDSQYFNFGTGDIFWSIADEERGYFYGSSFSMPTVFFADKIENYWGSYDSYQGVQNIWEFTNASDHEWFTQHSITFAESTSPYYTGILLIHQGDLYGAIKPKSIHNGDLSYPGEYVLEYDWWYDDSGGSDFSSLKPPPPLTVSISPTSASILVGQSVTFTSTVSGGYTPYSYQWYLNGIPVSGATSASWTFTPTTSGIYYIYLKVTDSLQPIGNTTQSETARITVVAVPVGGYSIPTKGYTTTKPLTLYLAIVAILTASFTIAKRRKKQQN